MSDTIFMFDDKLLQEIRDRFHHVDSCPYQGSRAFFENAGGSLTLKSVVEVNTQLSSIPDNQGRDNPASKELVRIIEQAREDAMTLIGASSGQIIVGESGTELLFRLVRTAVLGSQEGGTILGTSLEHPATRSAARQWAEKTNRKHVLIAHNDDTASINRDDYKKNMTADVRVATIIQTSPVTGMGTDVAAISHEIRSVSPDCFIIVDGIQHAAHGGIDVDAYNIDAFTMSAYKVFSKHNYGVAWLSPRMASMQHEHLDGSADTQWELGTRDTSAYATFSEVVRYVEWLGSNFTNSTDSRERILAAGTAMGEHEASLVEAMIDGIDGQRGLRNMSEVRLIGGHDNDNREGLVSLVVDGIPSVDVVSHLNNDGVRTHVRKSDYFSGNILDPLGLDSCVRVSMCHYNSAAEVKRFLQSLDKLLTTR